MAYSRVTRTRNGREAIAYAMGHGRGHDGSNQRNVCVSTVNMIPGVDFADQMEKYWSRARANHTTQVIRVVQSFSVKEFDPDSPADIEKANAVGRLFAAQHYPGRQAIVFTQIDGAGGKVHNHVLISDVHMETLKGCTKEMYFYRNVEKWTDAATEQFVDLDMGKQTEDKTTQTERVKREKGAYVWKDDLRERISAAVTEAKAEDDFLKCLTAHGVEATQRSSKKHGQYYTFELADFSDMPDGEEKPKHTKMRSYNLGAAFSPEAIRAAINEKRDHPAHEFEEAPAVSSNTRRTDDSATESLAPEIVSTFDPGMPLIPLLPPTEDDDEEVQRQRKRNEKRRRAMQQEMRKERHAELMRKFWRPGYDTTNPMKDYELSL